MVTPAGSGVLVLSGTDISRGGGVMGAVRLPGYETICNPTKYNAKHSAGWNLTSGRSIYQAARRLTFRRDASRGLYFHSNIWHGAFMHHSDHARFRDRQGRVHARVSVNFPKEFCCYLAAPLRAPR